MARSSRYPNHEFGVIRLRELPVDLPVCDSPERIYDYWVANVTRRRWYNPDAECCCAIHLNARRRATGFHLVGIGTLDSVLIQPREVYRTAIVRASASVVIAHNLCDEAHRLCYGKRGLMCSARDWARRVDSFNHRPGNPIRGGTRSPAVVPVFAGRGSHGPPLRS